MNQTSIAGVLLWALLEVGFESKAVSFSCEVKC